MEVVIDSHLLYHQRKRSHILFTYKKIVLRAIKIIAICVPIQSIKTILHTLRKL